VIKRGERDEPVLTWAGQRRATMVDTGKRKGVDRRDSWDGSKTCEDVTKSVGGSRCWQNRWVSTGCRKPSRALFFSVTFP
jgi:hypothetical protein